MKSTFRSHISRPSTCLDYVFPWLLFSRNSVLILIVGDICSPSPCLQWIGQLNGMLPNLHKHFWAKSIFSGCCKTCGRGVGEELAGSPSFLWLEKMLRKKSRFGSRDFHSTLWKLMWRENCKTRSNKNGEWSSVWRRAINISLTVGQIGCWQIHNNCSSELDAIYMNQEIVHFSCSFFENLKADTLGTTSPSPFARVVLPHNTYAGAAQRGRDFGHGAPDLERGIHFRDVSARTGYNISNVRKVIKLWDVISNYSQRICIKKYFKKQIKPLHPLLRAVGYLLVVIVWYHNPRVVPRGTLRHNLSGCIYIGMEKILRMMR